MSQRINIYSPVILHLVSSALTLSLMAIDLPLLFLWTLVSWSSQNKYFSQWCFHVKVSKCGKDSTSQELCTYTEVESCHFDENFITGCTGNCHFDNFHWSQWWKFHQNDGVSISVRFTLYFILFGVWYDWFYPYTSKLHHWCHGTLTIAPVPVKQPWKIKVNMSYGFTRRSAYNHSKTKHSQTMHIFYGIYCIVGPRCIDYFWQNNRLIRAAQDANDICFAPTIDVM